MLDRRMSWRRFVMQLRDPPSRPPGWLGALSAMVLALAAHTMQRGDARRFDRAGALTVY